MIKTIFIFIIVLILVGVGFFIYKKDTFAPTTFPTSNLECNNNQLSALITTEGAAGSIYGNLTITNTSDSECQISLGNLVKAKFSANNISYNYTVTSASQPFTLQPNQKVYSQIHYPNGPQCQSTISSKPISLVYESGSLSLNFKDMNGNTSFNISACLGTENTLINIWPVSATPIN